MKTENSGGKQGAEAVLEAHLDAWQVEQCIAGPAAGPDGLSGLDASQADGAGGVVTATSQVLLHTQQTLGKQGITEQQDNRPEQEAWQERT